MVLAAAACAVAVASGGTPHPQGETLLQWFGLAQQTIDEGRAPAGGERLAKQMGEREGNIPKGDVAADQEPHDLMENPRLSAAANARAMGASLRPLLDERGEEQADAGSAKPMPDWVREDYGETSQRQIGRAHV